MNKKYIYIGCTSLALCLIIGGALFLILQPTDNSSITKEHYFVQKGLEKYADATKLAVENYATQSSTEPQKDRDRRLANVFSGESELTTYPTNNLSPNIDKTTAKLTSIVDYGGEDNIRIMSAMVYVTLYSHNNILLSQPETYAVSFSDKSNKPLNIEQQYEQ